MVWSDQFRTKGFTNPTQTESNTDLGTTVTTNATADTFGAIVELIASTSFKATRFRLVFGSTVTSRNKQYTMMIMTGDATSEADLVAVTGGIRVITAVGAFNYFTSEHQIDIPSGTRISAKIKHEDISTPDALETFITIYG